MTTPHPAAAFNPPKSSQTVLCKIFLTALVIRYTYSIILYTTMGTPGLMQGDSFRYLSNAQTFAQDIISGSVHGWGWLGPDLKTMPIFTWLLTLHTMFAGSWAPLTYVLTQGLFDAGTCLLIYGMAQTLDHQYAVPAAVAASINPTQIVLSGLVYTDTLFVFFVALFLLGSLRWLRSPSWPSALVIGVALGASANCRILSAPWAPILVLFLLAATAARQMLKISHIKQMAATIVIFSICLAPVVLRNKIQYGAWALTSQSGVHFALWVVPLIKEAQDGMPWSRSVEETEKRVRDRYGPTDPSAFESSRRYREAGQEELKTLTLTAMVKAWAIGAVINLGAPAIIISPPIAQLPRKGYFATLGDTNLDKIANFLFHSDNAAYAWALILGIAGVAIARMIQLCGLIVLPRRKLEVSYLLVLGMWCIYILAINGPIASPKYRLPIEPPLMVLTGVGFCVLREWYRALRSNRLPTVALH